MRYYLVLFALLSFGSRLIAQLPEYYVHLVTGTVTVSKPGVKAVAAKQYQLVYKDDIIVLSKGSELTLADKGANFLILNKAGTYKAGDLIRYATQKSNKGALAVVAEQVFHEFVDPHADYEKFRKENIASSRAAGSRNDECNNLVFPVNGFKTSLDSIFFNWYNTSPSGYLFTIYNSRGEEIYRQNSKDSVLPVDVAKKLNGPGKYLWRVAGNEANCEDEIPVYFYILTPEKEKEEIGQLMIGTDSKNLEKQLQGIDKLEESGFVYAASAQYAALVKANPELAALRKSYVLFLLKYGFEKEAKLAWQ